MESYPPTAVTNYGITKNCSRCKMAKPRSEFYDSKGKCGKRPECILCSKRAVDEWRSANRVHTAAYQRAWTRAHPERVRGYDRKRRYGLTPSDYDALLIAQGGMCAIEGCGAAHSIDAPLHVDHDHSCCPESKTCGQCIRGLLCGACNIALGLIQENPRRLTGMSNYLSHYKGV